MEDYTERVLYLKPNNRDINYEEQKINIVEKIFGINFDIVKSGDDNNTAIIEEMEKCKKYSNNMLLAYVTYLLGGITHLQVNYLGLMPIQECVGTPSYVQSKMNQINTREFKQYGKAIKKHRKDGVEYYCIIPDSVADEMIGYSLRWSSHVVDRNLIDKYPEHLDHSLGANDYLAYFIGNSNLPIFEFEREYVIDAEGGTIISDLFLNYESICGVKKREYIEVDTGTQRGNTIFSKVLSYSLYYESLVATEGRMNNSLTFLFRPHNVCEEILSDKEPNHELLGYIALLAVKYNVNNLGNLVRALETEKDKKEISEFLKDKIIKIIKKIKKAGHKYAIENIDSYINSLNEKDNNPYIKIYEDYLEEYKKRRKYIRDKLLSELFKETYVDKGVHLMKAATAGLNINIVFGADLYRSALLLHSERNNIFMHIYSILRTAYYGTSDVEGNVEYYYGPSDGELRYPDVFKVQDSNIYPFALEDVDVNVGAYCRAICESVAYQRATLDDIRPIYIVESTDSVMELIWHTLRFNSDYPWSMEDYEINTVKEIEDDLIPIFILREWIESRLKKETPKTKPFLIKDISRLRDRIKQDRRYINGDNYMQLKKEHIDSVRDSIVIYEIN